jgi:hypothetical protein
MFDTEWSEVLTASLNKPQMKKLMKYLPCNTVRGVKIKKAEIYRACSKRSSEYSAGYLGEVYRIIIFE